MYFYAKGGSVASARGTGGSVWEPYGTKQPCSLPEAVCVTGPPAEGRPKAGPGRRPAPLNNNANRTEFSKNRFQVPRPLEKYTTRLFRPENRPANIPAHNRTSRK